MLCGCLQVWALVCEEGGEWAHEWRADLGEHAVDITAVAVHAGRQLAATADNVRACNAFFF